MNSNLNASNIKIKHNSKVKKHWEYDPVTGEEQESFIDIIPLEEKPKQTQQDLFSYEERKTVICCQCKCEIPESLSTDATEYGWEGSICNDCIDMILSQPDINDQYV